MVEPTESESKAELDRFIDAMIAIRGEIRAIEEGRADRADNALKHAPHTAAAVAARRVERTRTRARTPRIPSRRCAAAKYWPPVARVDNVYGDRNLFCSCIPLADYADGATREAPAGVAARPDADAHPRPRRGRGRRHRRVVSRRRTGTRSRWSTGSRAPALETSFANGGQISASHAEPWANPGRAAQDPASGWAATTRRSCSGCAPIRSNGAGGLQFLLECLPSRTRHNTIQCLNLALYSRDCLQALRAPTGIEYDHLERGILAFYTDADGIRRRASKAAALMREFGVRPRREDRRRVRRDRAGARAPAATRLAGGIFTATDESGDAQRFTQELARLAAARGVRFRWGMTIESLVAEGDAMTRRALQSNDASIATEIARRRRVRGRARQLQPVPADAARRAVPHLSGEGLLGDDRHRRPSRRADGVADRSRVRRSCSRASATGCASPAPRSCPATART